MLEKQRDIDAIVERVQREIPACRVQQLQVKHPDSDDDGIWYFSLPGIEREIQIESSFGMCPFIVETNEQSSYNARNADTVDMAASMIVDYLYSLASATQNLDNSSNQTG